VRRWWRLDIEAPRPQRDGSPKVQENPNTKDRGGDCSMHVRKTVCHAHAICKCTSMLSVGTRLEVAGRAEEHPESPSMIAASQTNAVDQ
jgi:hypothetical protein